jgi:hypothetical protein
MSQRPITTLDRQRYMEPISPNWDREGQDISAGSRSVLRTVLNCSINRVEGILLEIGSGLTGPFFFPHYVV